MQCVLCGKLKKYMSKRQMADGSHDLLDTCACVDVSRCRPCLEDLANSTSKVWIDTIIFFTLLYFHDSLFIFTIMSRFMFSIFIFSRL